MGNDFIIIDAIEDNLSLDKDLILKLSERRKGIGCDQVLLIRKSDIADAEMVVFNSDGTKSEACGNGARCVAKYLADRISKSKIQLFSENKILFDAIIGIKVLNLNFTILGEIEKPGRYFFDEPNLNIFHGCFTKTFLTTRALKGIPIKGLTTLEDE